MALMKTFKPSGMVRCAAQQTVIEILALGGGVPLP